MTDVYLGLGSNTDARKHLRGALRALETKFGHIEWSPVYSSPAVGFEGDDFLNMVVKIKTNLQARALRDWLRLLEDEHGRDRSQPKFSDRSLDVDILLFGNRVQNKDDIELPRGEILHYAHVLKPLADLAPRLRHPLEKKSYRRLWREFAEHNDTQLFLTTL